MICSNCKSKISRNEYGEKISSWYDIVCIHCGHIEREKLIEKYKKTFMELCDVFDKIDRLNEKIDKLEKDLEIYAELIEENKIELKVTKEEAEEISHCLWFLNKKMKGRRLLKFWRRFKSFFTETGHSSIDY